MTVLLLGGTGFVGRNIKNALETAGVAFVSSSRSHGVDLLDSSAIASLLKRVQPAIIINAAAQVGSLNYVTEQAADVIVRNTRMILNLYEAVAQTCSDAVLVNPIANCAYPATTNTFDEDHWWDGHLHRSVLSYGSTRRLLWSVAECFQMQHRLRSVHFLVPNMYGPFDSTDPNKAHALNALAAKFVKAKSTGQKEVVVWGTGVAVREWLYASDFARVLLEFVRNPNMIGLDEPTNVGQNFGLTVRELVTLVLSATGYEGRVRYDSSMPDGAPRKVMNDKRFRKLFPNFIFTPLEEGLRQAIRYYESVLPF